MVRVYLINLDRSPERLARMARALGAMHLDFVRVPAVDGAALSPAEREAWMDARPRDGRACWLPGQIGCLESHLRVWRLIAEATDQIAIVLEDDLHLSSDFNLLVNSDGWWPDEADLVHLETTLQGMKLGSAEHSTVLNRDFHPLRSEAWGAAAYGIRRETAAWLAATPNKLLFPTDILLYNRDLSLRARGLRTFQVNPALAIQDGFVDQHAGGEGIASLITGAAVTPRAESDFRKQLRKIGRRFRGRTLVPQS